MTKTIALIITLSISNITNSHNLSMEEVRNNYVKAVSDKQVCKTMISNLIGNHENNNVYLAYLGAFQAIWANHTINPIEKLNTFNKGKNNIDKALKMSEDNIEIRFIRYSIQKKTPAFLGYKDALQIDKDFLLQRQHTISSPALKRMVNNILKS